MNQEFWRDRRVLLTGHTGFKGSWLTAWLKHLGADLVGYALEPPSRPNLFEVSDGARGMRSIIGDVRDLDRLRKVFREHRPEVLLHLAAQPIVRTSYAEPVDTYSTNVLGSVHVLEAAREIDELRVSIMVTSDKCYENKEWPWAYRENDSLGGKDPYSSSKACAELVVSAYRESFFAPGRYGEHGLAVASARAGNVIGGGDWARDRLVPDILTAITDGRPVQIRAPSATRPWQFVLEALGGYLLLAERLWEDGPRFAESWNFGPDVEDVKPVSWITDYLTRAWGDGAAWTLDERQRPGESHFLMLDCAKAKGLLQWRPKINIATALDWVIEWHRAYVNGADMTHVVAEQIQRYEKMQ